MLSRIDYAIWILGFLVEAGAVVCFIARRNFSKYIFLSTYLLAATFVTVGQYWFIHKFGWSSIEYRYYYYYSESLLTILLFFVVIQFYDRVFEELNASRYVRRGAIILVGATALFSYFVIRANQDHLTSRFVVELGQNLYFVGVVLTYLLWGAILKLRETRTRLIQLVLALGVYFSATAAAYALRNLFPALQPAVLRWVPPIAGIWLPAAWAYTMMKVSEDSHLVTSHLLARAR
jgi:hypothetical protein